MANNSTLSIVRGIAFSSLIILLLYYVIAFVFSYLELFGKDVDSGTDTESVFGTGAYFIILMAFPVVMLVTMMISGHYDAKLSTGVDKAQFIYARYQWNMWLFYVFGFFTWLLTFCLLLSFMIIYGFGVDVNINSSTFSSLLILRFKTVTMLYMVSSFLMIGITLIAVYTYIIKSFELLPLDTIEEAIKISMSAPSQTLSNAKFDPTSNRTDSNVTNDIDYADDDNDDYV